MWRRLAWRVFQDRGRGAGLRQRAGCSVSSGSASYCAERTPELPQTVRFVIGVVKGGERDGALGEYVMALAFGESWALRTYDARAAAPRFAATSAAPTVTSHEKYTHSRNMGNTAKPPYTAL